MQIKLTPFYDRAKVGILLERTKLTAHSPREARRFLSILRRAREELMELESLYEELPGVLSGEHGAIERFRDVLEGVGGQDFGNSASAGEFLPGFGAFSPGGALACGASFIVDPSIIVELAQGVRRVAEGNVAAYERYANTVVSLWERGEALDKLLHESVRSSSTTFDPLRSELKRIARDYEKAGWLFPEPGGFGYPTPEGGPGYPPPEGGVFGYPVPDWPGWPGPDDGPPIPGCPAVTCPAASLPDCREAGRRKVRKDPAGLAADSLICVSWKPTAVAGSFARQ